jgi:ABC-type glycerol-3-phosphate transport system substrate-binding protein
MTRPLARRQALRTLAFGSCGVVLAACQAKIVEKIVEKTVLVERITEKVVKETVLVQSTPRVVEKVVTQTPSPRAPVVIRCIVSLNPSGGQSYWNAAKALYEETYSGCSVEMTLPGTWADLREAIALAIAAGEPFDGFSCQDDDVARFWKQGAAGPLDDLCDADKRWTMTKWSRACQAQITQEYTYNNHLIAIPQYTAPMFWVYNKAKMEEHGLRMPDNWDEFRRIGKELQGKGHAYPFHISSPGGWSGHYQLWGFGAAGVTNEAGDQQLLDSPEVLAAIENWWNLYHVDKLCDLEWETGRAPNAIAEAEKGDLLAWEDGPWSLRASYKENAALFPLIGVYPRPGGPKGRITNVGGSCSMLSSRTRHPSEVWDFYMTANDEELLADQWLIPHLDTVPPIGAYQKPQVRQKAPLMADLLEIMNSEGRVVGGVPWYWDVVAIHDNMLKEMIRVDSWTEATSHVRDAATRAQQAIDAAMSGLDSTE